MNDSVDSNPAFALRSRRIVTPAGTVDGTVWFEGGTITGITRDSAPQHPEIAKSSVTDLGGLALLSGLIDAHVHLNDPRRTGDPRDEPWEGFDSGTRAAAAGGITAVVDMPLNALPVTTTVEALQQKRDAARNRCHVDVGFYAGLIPGNLDELPGLIDAGVLGVKCFLCDSGLPEFPAVDHGTLAEAMALLAAHPGPDGRTLALLVHAERVTELPCQLASLDPRKHASWLASRPGAFERAAVSELLELVAETGCRLHVVHVADADTLSLLRDAKAAGLPVTAETCPHYLAFSAADVPDGNPRFKCAPPIRELRHREALWDALRDGTLDLVASDHSPCPRKMKQLDTGDFFRAWGGIASLQLGPVVTWTHAQPRGFALDDLARWWGHAPAQLLGLPHGIAPGKPANLVAFDPDAAWTVDADALHHRHPVTPYDGMLLRGQVRHVWLRGDPVVRDGELDPTPRGAEASTLGVRDFSFGLPS